MRVTKRMLDVAQDVLGYEVDAQRIRQAFAAQPKDFSLKAAKQRLKRLEVQFNAAVGVK